MTAPAGLGARADVAVELRHVAKRFGSVEAVRGVSLQIKQNEFFSLLGPSGCGKTTILRMIGGFERPSEGEVYLEGRLANDVPPYRRDTNLIFQHLALFPHLDVFDNIAFGLRMKRIDRSLIREKVLQSLELVDLVGFGARRIHELSGGQRQRVAIARALVNGPAVLLLDEPLGALDLRLRMQMQVELKEIQHRVGTTFVYVTHDQSEALTMSDRIAVMQEGRVVQVGEGRDVYERPRSRFVATFLGDSNLFEGRVLAVGPAGTTIEASDLNVIAPTHGDVAPGAAACVSVRPERLRLLDASAVRSERGRYDNSLQARVHRITFKGAVTEYRLVTPSGASLSVHTHADAGRSPTEGEAVVVGWRKDDGVVLTA